MQWGNSQQPDADTASFGENSSFCFVSLTLLRPAEKEVCTRMQCTRKSDKWTRLRRNFPVSHGMAIVKRFIQFDISQTTPRHKLKDKVSIQMKNNFNSFCQIARSLRNRWTTSSLAWPTSCLFDTRLYK